MWRQSSYVELSADEMHITTPIGTVRCGELGNLSRSSWSVLPLQTTSDICTGSRRGLRAWFELEFMSVDCARASMRFEQLVTTGRNGNLSEF